MTLEEKEFKNRESRLRRRLANQGYALKKNRSQINPYNIGGYMIINLSTNFIECGAEACGFTLDLDDVENFLNQDDAKNPEEEQAKKQRENKARYRLLRQGLRLMKNRAKSYPNNIGGYMIANRTTNAVEYGAGDGGYALRLDEVEEILAKEKLN